MIIAIDGPAASGKGTLARRLATYLGYAHLDTGALYRATALIVLDAGGDPEDPAVAEAAARKLTPQVLANPLLRQELVGKAASHVAAIPAVRAALLAFQRDFAAHPPGQAPGAVLDGRDVGTVICPDAPVKFFVTASVEERARRRLAELQTRGAAVDYDRVLQDLKVRDARDAARTHAPMMRAADAVLIDTTEMDIETAFAEALRHVEALMAEQA